MSKLHFVDAAKTYHRNLLENPEMWRPPGGDALVLYKDGHVGYVSAHARSLCTQMPENAMASPGTASQYCHCAKSLLVPLLCQLHECTSRSGLVQHDLGW